MSDAQKPPVLRSESGPSALGCRGVVSGRLRHARLAPEIRDGLKREGGGTGGRVGVTGAAGGGDGDANIEKGVSGKQIDETTIVAADASMIDPADLLSDQRASDECRAHLCSVMAKHAVTTEARRAMG